jgi:hypothetical protein
MSFGFIQDADYFYISYVHYLNVKHNDFPL